MKDRYAEIDQAELHTTYISVRPSQRLLSSSSSSSSTPSSEGMRRWRASTESNRFLWTEHKPTLYFSPWHAPIFQTFFSCTSSLNLITFTLFTFLSQNIWPTCSHISYNRLTICKYPSCWWCDPESFKRHQKINVLNCGHILLFLVHPSYRLS